jgi:hypothetical protein
MSGLFPAVQFFRSQRLQGDEYKQDIERNPQM